MRTSRPCRWLAMFLVACLVVAPIENRAWPPAEPLSAAERDSGGSAADEDGRELAAGLLQQRPVVRSPLAMALVDDDARLLVANRDSGTLSILNAADGQVEAEHRLSRQVSDLAVLPDQRYLLATDEVEHQLRLFRRDGTSLTPLASLRMPDYPVQVRIDGSGRYAYVTSLWSRKLTLVEVDLPSESGPAEVRLRISGALSLPFAPRMALLVPEHRLLIVADSFGGRLALVDTDGGLRLRGLRDLPAHNIRGLALSVDGGKVLISHQILNDLAETTHNDVHWGVLMSNVLRWVRLDRLLEGDEVLVGSHVHLTGDTANAGGDPAAVAVAHQGFAVVVLGGVNQVGMGAEKDFVLERLNIGRRPAAVAIAADGTRAFVANMFDDTVSVIDPQRVMNVATWPLGSRPELTAVQRGEQLFYDARLALDGWFSCHSCHTDGHANGLLNDNLGDNNFGSAKRVLSLLGVRDTAPYAWNGRTPALATQIRKSIASTMQGREPEDHVVADLEAYLETLTPPPGVGTFDVSPQSQAAAERGRALFESRGCRACHQGEAYTSAQTYDVGLSDKFGRNHYNPPSLRGVSQRGPYFHDNSAPTLEAVIESHPGPDPQPLEDDQRADLLAFLRTL